MECLRSITPLAHLTLPKRQQNRIRDLRSKFARTRGQSRSSTAIEHPKKFGRCGFDSHRARQFRRAAEFGLSAKRETASAFKPRTIGQPMDSHLASCPSFLFGMGRCALVIELGSSNCDRAARENEKMRVRFPSRNIEATSCPSFSIFDGSQDWVIAHNDVVAGSSPASGTKCRSSSGGRARNSQFVSYPSVLSAGRRLWIIGTVSWRFKSALLLRRK